MDKINAETLETVYIYIYIYRLTSSKNKEAYGYSTYAFFANAKTY